MKLPNAATCSLSMRIVGLCLLFAFAGLRGPAALNAQTVLRISLENSADHIQTQTLKTFAEQLHQRSGGQIAVELHHSGTLFRDQDVIGALSRAQVDMAVPGNWHVSRFLPEVSVFLLPHFFGRDAGFIHEHSDGELGQELSSRIERTLQVVVPGRWLDLGPGHMYFRNRQVRNHSDIRGMTIRVAGGLGNELRIAALGAEPVTVAWNEVPRRVAGGHIDGLLTTHETVRSGRLWESGIAYALEDHQYFPQYIPMIRRGFWDRLRAAQQDLIRELWEELVEPQREAAARSQTVARRILLEHGVRIQELAGGELREIRERLVGQQDDMAGQLGIPPDVMEFLNATY